MKPLDPSLSLDTLLAQILEEKAEKPTANIKELVLTAGENIALYLHTEHITCICGAEYISPMPDLLLKVWHQRGKWMEYKPVDCLELYVHLPRKKMVTCITTPACPACFATLKHLCPATEEVTYEC